MNDDRIIDVLAQIEYNAPRFFAGEPDALGFNMGFWFAEVGFQEIASIQETNICGTVACLAGHAIAHEGIYTLMAGSDYASRVVKDGDHMHGEMVDVESHAANYLGITAGQANILFYLDTLDEVYDWVARNMGVDEQVLRDKVAAHG